MSKLKSVACVFAVLATYGDNPHAVGVSEATTAINLPLNAASKPRIVKCCNAKQIVFMQSDEADSGNCKWKKKAKATELSFEKAKVYNSNHEQVVVGSAFETFISPYEFIISNHTSINKGYHYFTENGELIVETPHRWIRWTTYNSKQYCIDYVQLFGTEGVFEWRAFIWTEDLRPVARNDLVGTVAMLISCCFLIATLAVYCFVPELRNLHGKVLMAYAGSLFVFFLSHSLTYIQLFYVGADRKTLCPRNALIIYYSCMATFFWMNIMSYDIWWKFRGIIRAEKTNRRGETHKFRMYCLYGFGCPLIMTIIFGVLNFLPDESLRSSVVTPRIPEGGCFIGTMERIPYLYIPMSIITCVNCLLFVMTAFNIYKLNRDCRRVENSGTVKGKEQLLLYLKIFCLMGLTWLLDIAGTTSPGLEIWYLSDALTCLIGVFIFFIFVGKRRILGMVTKQYRERVSTLTSHGRSRCQRPSAASTSGIESDRSETTDYEYAQQDVESNPKAAEAKVTIITSLDSSVKCNPTEHTPCLNVVP